MRISFYCSRVAQPIKTALHVADNMTAKKAICVAGGLFAAFLWDKKIGYTALISLGLLYSIRVYKTKSFERKVNDTRIQFYRSGNRLFYKTIDSGNRIVDSACVAPALSMSIIEQIEQLKRMHFVLKEIPRKGRKPEFCILPKPNVEWSYKGIKIRLFVIKNRQHWQLENPSRDRVIQAYPKCIPSKTMREFSKGIFQVLSDYHFNDEEMFRNYRIKKIENSSRIPSSITFEPVWVASKIDRRIRVSHFYWGVTLINTGRSSKKETKLQYGHAALLFEFIENGEYQMVMAHLTDQGEKKRSFSPNEYEKYASKNRSPVWKFSRTVVEPFLKAIRLNEGHFSYWGSWVGPEAGNCAEWAIKQLACCGLTFISSPLDIIRGDVPTDYTYAPRTYKNSPYPDHVIQWASYYGEDIDRGCLLIDKDGV